MEQVDSQNRISGSDGLSKLAKDINHARVELIKINSNNIENNNNNSNQKINILIECQHNHIII